ncbi:MAG TPA: DinB family protein [Cyclobacteriaceae bacterium]|nr:DinB family protein [Cyclobacteriaceae bacterium]
MTNEEILSMWKMGRTRLTNLLPEINSDDLHKKLHPESNNIGWMLRHIAEVEHLFAKNVFGQDVKVTVLTIGHQSTSKERFTNLDELKGFSDEAVQHLINAINAQEEGAWDEQISTKEFGTVKKSDAIARIMTHTAWHAGQIKLALKYGT